jgi:hypothetical protein
LGGRNKCTRKSLAGTTIARGSANFSIQFTVIWWVESLYHKTFSVWRVILNGIWNHVENIAALEFVLHVLIPDSPPNSVGLTCIHLLLASWNLETYPIWGVERYSPSHNRTEEGVRERKFISSWMENYWPFFHLISSTQQHSIAQVRDAWPLLPNSRPTGSCISGLYNSFKMQINFSLCSNVECVCLNVFESPLLCKIHCWCIISCTALKKSQSLSIYSDQQ